MEYEDCVNWPICFHSCGPECSCHPEHKQWMEEISKERKSMATIRLSHEEINVIVALISERIKQIKGYHLSEENILMELKTKLEK